MEPQSHYGSVNWKIVSHLSVHANIREFDINGDPKEAPKASAKPT